MNNILLAQKDCFASFSLISAQSMTLLPKKALFRCCRNVVVNFGMLSNVICSCNMFSETGRPFSSITQGWLRAIGPGPMCRRGSKLHGCCRYRFVCRVSSTCIKLAWWSISAKQKNRSIVMERATVVVLVRQFSHQVCPV